MGHYQYKILWGFLTGRYPKYFQPLNIIKSYYGEKYAFEYAFLLHYQAYLLFPSLVGLLWIFWFLYRYSSAPESKALEVGGEGKLQYGLDSEVNVLIGLLITLWATVFVESWKRKQRTIQYLWNCKDISFSKQDERDETFKFYEVFNHRTGNVEKHRRVLATCKDIAYRGASLACLVAIVYIMTAYRGMLRESKEEGQVYYGWG
jgi:hypothetical protein